ncbi:hypothetical protein AOCH_007546 [Aspergillus ochraceoroseus]|nr:hypothetical protein AOCH_007546 [Aspergillus ochraceoroseus]
MQIPPPNAASKPSLDTNAASIVPGITSLMSGPPIGALPSISAPAGPGAGRAAEGPRDIPNDKIGCGGEDLRALRQLDRVFTA